MESLMCLLVVIGIIGLIISGSVMVYNKIKGNKIESNLWKLLIAFGLSFVIGICFFPIDDTEVEDKNTTTQEEQVEDEDSYSDPSDNKVEDNTEDEEVVEEPKEETEEPKDTTEDENIDGYVNDNVSPILYSPSIFLCIASCSSKSSKSVAKLGVIMLPPIKILANKILIPLFIFISISPFYFKIHHT